MNLQQTPNPTAQFPSALPPLELHCDDVKHVPFVLKFFVKNQHLFFAEIKPNLASLLAEQASFLNLTIENRENCPENIHIYIARNTNNLTVCSAGIICSLCPKK